jgi:hypothetical protein
MPNLLRQKELAEKLHVSEDANQRDSSYRDLMLILAEWVAKIEENAFLRAIESGKTEDSPPSIFKLPSNGWFQVPRERAPVYSLFVFYNSLYKSGNEETIPPFGIIFKVMAASTVRSISCHRSRQCAAAR